MGFLDTAGAASDGSTVAMGKPRRVVHRLGDDADGSFSFMLCTEATANALCLGVLHSLEVRLLIDSFVGAWWHT